MTGTDLKMCETDLLTGTKKLKIPKEKILDVRAKDFQGKTFSQMHRLLENSSMYPMSEGEYRTGLRSWLRLTEFQIRSSTVEKRKRWFKINSSLLQCHIFIYEFKLLQFRWEFGCLTMLWIRKRLILNSVSDIKWRTEDVWSLIKIYIYTNSS